jgi:hypothetical protein
VQITLALPGGGVSDARRTVVSHGIASMGRHIEERKHGASTIIVCAFARAEPRRQRCDSIV